MKKIILFINVLFLFACTKDINIEPSKPEPCIYNCPVETKLKVVWQEPLAPDTLDVGAETPIVYKNDVIFNKQFHGPYDVLVKRNGQTGHKIWGWEDPINIQSAASITNAKEYNEKLFVGTWDDVYCINMDNGQTVWETHVCCGEPGIGQFENYIFHGHTSDDTEFLVRTDVNFGVWDTIFSITEKDNYIPNIESLTGWTHPSGDKILIFQNRQHIPFPYDGKIDLYAYNMTADSVLWMLDDIIPRGNSSLDHPVIDGSRIYFRGVGKILCINALKGGIVWEQEDIEWGNNGSLNIVGNKVVMNISDFQVLDAHLGDVIKTIELDGAGNNSDMVVHDGVAYFTSGGDGRLHAIDISSGVQIWDEYSPNRTNKRSASFATGGVDINPELGYLYTNDGYFAMCIELPK